MNTLCRRLCIVILVSVLTAACGDDDNSTTPTSGGPAATTTTAPGQPVSTTAPAAVVQNATDGAPCPAVGARGVTQGGLPLTCTTLPADSQTRWRPA